MTERQENEQRWPHAKNDQEEQEVVVVSSGGTNGAGGKVHLQSTIVYNARSTSGIGMIPPVSSNRNDEEEWGREIGDHARDHPHDEGLDGEEVGFEVEMNIASPDVRPEEEGGGEEEGMIPLLQPTAAVGNKEGISGRGYSTMKTAYDNFKSFSRKGDLDPTWRPSFDCKPPSSSSGSSQSGKYKSSIDSSSTDSSGSSGSSGSSSSTHSQVRTAMSRKARDHSGAAQESIPEMIISKGTDRTQGDTPKAHNRSSRDFVTRPKKKSCGKPEGIKHTLATVIQELETVCEQDHDVEDNDESQREGMTVKPKTDSISSGSGTEQHTDNTGSSGSSGIIDHKWEILRSRSDGSNDDSGSCREAEIDAGAYLLSNPASSSEEAVQQWEEYMGKLLLAEREEQSETGLSGSFEDQLIQDCIETGLPSMTSPRSQSCLSPSSEAQKSPPQSPTKLPRLPAWKSRISSRGRLDLDEQIESASSSKLPTATKVNPHMTEKKRLNHALRVLKQRIESLQQAKEKSEAGVKGDTRVTIDQVPDSADLTKDVSGVIQKKTKTNADGTSSEPSSSDENVSSLQAVASNSFVDEDSDRQETPVQRIEVSLLPSTSSFGLQELKADESATGVTDESDEAEVFTNTGSPSRPKPDSNLQRRETPESAISLKDIPSLTKGGGCQMKGKQRGLSIDTRLQGQSPSDEGRLEAKTGDPHGKSPVLALVKRFEKQGEGGLDEKQGNPKVQAAINKYGKKHKKNPITVDRVEVQQRDDSEQGQNSGEVSSNESFSTAVADDEAKAANETLSRPASHDENTEETKQAEIPERHEIEGIREVQSEESPVQDFHEGEILEINSTLTGSFSKRSLEKEYRHPIDTSEQRTSQEDDTESGVFPMGWVDGGSFESSLTASNTGIPGWRLQPTESLADFSLQIVNSANYESKTYHIHKHVVAIGPRRSDYLDQKFRSISLSSTSIELDEQCSSFFPLLLDYMYCHDVEIITTDRTAVAYRHMALKFKVAPLLVDITEYILKSLTIESMPAYIVQSDFYNDDKIKELIVARCAQAVEKIPLDDPIWIAMKPEQFLAVISYSKLDREKLSSHLSILVVEYQNIHKEEVDLTTFAALISEELIPIIDRQAALPILEIIDEYGSPPVFFQAVQERAAQVIASYWKITNDTDRNRLFSLLRSLPSAFTVDFLEAVEPGKTTSVLAKRTARRRRMKPKDNEEEERRKDEPFSIMSLCEAILDEDGYSMGNGDDELSWRMAAEVSFSDWKLKVKNRENGHEDIYHVHKHVLAVGQYKSSFFSDVFVSGNHEEAHRRRGTTTIELAEGPAKLVPLMLDFMYDREHRLNLSVKTAVALRFVSRVFGVRLLNEHIWNFMVKDMNVNNAMGYLTESETFDDHHLSDIVISVCARDIEQIESESPLLVELKPAVFARIIAKNEVQDENSCHVCILIAKYFALHDLDEIFLAELMRLTEIQVIDCMSALKLLEVLSPLRLKEIATFRTLKARCCTVITENWEVLRDQHREQIFALFRTLEPELLVDIFDAVENDYYQQHYQTMSMQSKLVKRYRSQLSDAKMQREEEVTRLQEEMKNRVSELTSEQEDLTSRLSAHNNSSTWRAARSTQGAPRPISPTRRRPTQIPKPSPSKLSPGQFTITTSDGLRKIGSPSCITTPMQLAAARRKRREEQEANAATPKGDASVKASSKKPHKSSSEQQTTRKDTKPQLVTEENGAPPVTAPAVTSNASGTPGATKSSVTTFFGFRMF